MSNIPKCRRPRAKCKSGIVLIHRPRVQSFDLVEISRSKELVRITLHVHELHHTNVLIMIHFNWQLQTSVESSSVRLPPICEYTNASSAHRRRTSGY